MFDNSYFKYIKEQYDDELLVLETDDVLFKDDGFRYRHLLFTFLNLHSFMLRDNVCCASGAAPKHRLLIVATFTWHIKP